MKGLGMAVRLALVVCAAVLLTACVSTGDRLLDADTDTSQVQLRSMQVRAFDTVDRERMLRTVVATLQDLGFVLDAGEVGLGTVSGTRYIDLSKMRITVSVWPRGESQLLVRASCELQRKPVEDPATYQRFFSALSKAVFLDAHEIE
jgi:hypothetical protein